MSLEPVTNILSRYLSARSERRWRILRKSLAAGAGKRFITQTAGLQTARRNLYWLSAVILLVLVADILGGVLELTLLAKLSIPVAPLLVLFLAYLVLLWAQFLQEKWRVDMQHSEVAIEQGQTSDLLDAAADRHAKGVKAIAAAQEAWAAQLRTDVDRSPADPLTRQMRGSLREIIEKFESDQEQAQRKGARPSYRIAQWIDVLRLTESLPAPPQVITEAQYEAAMASGSELLTQLEQQKTELLVASTDLLALSTGFRFRERLFYVFVDSFLPQAVAALAMVMGVNDIVYHAGTHAGTCLPLIEVFCPVAS